MTGGGFGVAALSCTCSNLPQHSVHTGKRATIASRRAIFLASETKRATYKQKSKQTTLVPSKTSHETLVKRIFRYTYKGRATYTGGNK